jgi:RIO-like serine/threonine protein kinase
MNQHNHCLLCTLQVEMGMKNHELVNTKLIATIAQLAGGGAHKILMRLSKERLVAYERGKHCNARFHLFILSFIHF